MNGHVLKTCRALLFGWFLLAIVAGPALAVDGVIEISQARAEEGGVTAGDAPDFPVTISDRGSYILTGNLVTPDPDITIIEITTDNVTIDLNGFSIVGPVQCSGPPMSCSPTSAGYGVTAGYTTKNVTVLNGNVRGFGHGVVVADASRVENVHVSHNRFLGITTAQTSLVEGCTAELNGDFGINGQNGSVVTRSTARNNKWGIGGNGVIVAESTAQGTRTSASALAATAWCGTAFPMGTEATEYRPWDSAS